MKVDISLEKYLQEGGDLNKIDPSKTFCKYHDKNQFVPIISFDDRGDMLGNHKLVYFTFENGNTHRYSLMWIYTQVELILHERFI